MKLFILKSLAAEDASLEGVGVSVHRTRDDAIQSFIRDWELWNRELDPETDEDMIVDVVAAAEALRELGYSEVLEVSYTIEEYELAD